MQPRRRELYLDSICWDHSFSTRPATRQLQRLASCHYPIPERGRRAESSDALNATLHRSDAQEGEVGIARKSSRDSASADRVYGMVFVQLDVSPLEAANSTANRVPSMT